MKKIGLLLVFLCSMIGIAAQNYSVKIECPDTVGVDKTMRIVYRISSLDSECSVKYDEFRATNAEVLSGPITSTSTSYSFINGVKSVTDYTCTYVISADSRNEDVVIEPLNFEISKGATVQEILVAPGKVIKVIDGYKATVSDSVGKKEAKPTRKNITSLQDINPDDMIIKWSASAKSINLGDTIHCYCDVYTKIDITSIGKSYDIGLDDCYVEEDSIPVNMEVNTVDYNGEQYWHGRYMGYRLTPLRTGHFNIGGDTFFCNVRFIDPNIDPLEAFFSGESSYHEMLYSEKSESVEFDVKGEMQSQSTAPQHLGSTGKKYLLCDISTSMKSRDFNPDRMTTAKTLVGDWLKESTDCGLITFAGSIESIQKTNAVIDTVSFPENPKVDGTALGDAILAAPALGEDVSDIILVTDGANNAGHFSLRTAIDILSQHNIRMSIIYLNSCKDSIDYPVSDSIYTVSNSYLEQKQIKEISKLIESTGGLFVKATSEEELKNVMPKLQAIVSKPRRQTKTESKLDAMQVGTALRRLADELLVKE